MHRFRSTDGGQVAVALVGKNHIVRPGTLKTRSYSLSPAMRSLHHIAGKIIVAHYRTAHGRNAHGFPLHAQLIQGLSHQTVDDSMRAAGTIMQRSIRQRRRFLKYNSHKVDPSFLTLCCSQIAQPKSGIS